MIPHSKIQEPYRKYLTNDDVVLRTHYTWGCIVLRKSEDEEQFMWINGERFSSEGATDPNTRLPIKLKFDYAPSNPLLFDEVSE